MTATVAIVGRPNVGKSTLFNRLVGRRQAIVDSSAGTTRDRREGEARLHDLEFRAVDTGGLEDAPEVTLAGRIRAQTARAVAQADLVLFVIDARAGVMPADSHFAQWLRRAGKPVVLVANKAEHARSAQAGIAEAWRLGFGEPVAVAAEHDLGLPDLRDAMAKHLSAPPEDAAEAPAAAGERPLRLAVVGRPNVGKSTLVNTLVGEERMLVGPEAGITRDAIALDWQHRGRPVRLVDTAGLRRRSKVAEKLEALSRADSERAIDLAEVVVLVIDATQGLDRQDLTIARRAAEEGRAIVIAANKWDAVAERDAALRVLRRRIEVSLPQIKGVAMVPVSALYGERLDALVDAAFAARETWSRKLGTPALNRFLSGMQAGHTPPLVAGRRLKFRYITQTGTRPPSFRLFANQADAVPGDYMRYLVNGLRQAFDLPGVPIRLELRQGDNPYAKRKPRPAR